MTGRPGEPASRGQDNDSGGGSNSSSGDGDRYAYPLESGSGFDGGVADHMARAFGNWQSDNAVDISCSIGTKVLAVDEGTIGRVTIDDTYDPAGNPNGSSVYLECSGGRQFWYTHLKTVEVQAGDQIDKAGLIGTSGTANSVDHLHFAAMPPLNPEEVVTGAETTGPSSGGGGGSSDTGQLDESTAKAAAISTYLQFPALMINEESMALTGDRSLLNDQQLLPFIEELCQASLRSFQSMPNGNFFGFYPDYFGGLNHRTPYWEIDDIEIISGSILLSDDALITHMYVVGDTDTFDGNVDILDKMRTAGIVTVFNAFMADFLNGVSSPALKTKKKENQKEEKEAQREYEKQLQRLPTLAKKERAIKFLKKYGARPAFEAAPMVRTPYYEKFLAYQKFCLAWSRQFLTTFEFTFMPELFPGGIIAFPNHGIQCYVDEVEHECSYSGGFLTRANLSAPAAIKDQNGIRHGPKKYVHEGMIRGDVFSDSIKDDVKLREEAPF